MTRCGYPCQVSKGGIQVCQFSKGISFTAFVDHIRNFQSPITGEIIMKTFGIPPSKLIGDIKEEIKESILEGEIHNKYEEAFRLMLDLGSKKGLKIANK
jgi:hypothetical protein